MQRLLVADQDRVVEQVAVAAHQAGDEAVADPLLQVADGQRVGVQGRQGGRRADAREELLADQGAGFGLDGDEARLGA